MIFFPLQGIDLTRSTLKALSDQGDTGKVQGDTNELTSLVTAIPNQGILQPYEKIPVFFRFSPRYCFFTHYILCTYLKTCLNILFKSTKYQNI
jgi:hypothetical protein